ncbi:glucose/sorbosone dehydrogenase [Leptolyngbya sp. 'hensonii']|nr:glucose/sorbosone dehydrogenase [Leptolyngbya sp. 'hensonii']
MAATRSGLKPNRISLSKGRSFNLYLPSELRITVAAQGLKRVRFMAPSPDGRIFVTDMHDKTDNQKGKIYILQDFDTKQNRFRQVIPYLTGLRNPNSITFHTDRAGLQWLYVALTDRLVRYPYRNGDNAPSGSLQVVAQFPAYGLSYKYGGWHLTRTVLIANEKVYVSVGSSCNACEEKEAVRATVLEMDLDGKNQQIFASGLRNAVGLKWVEGQLFATNMGSDHLGDDRPEETFYALKPQQNYGWPYCYQYQSRLYADPQFQSSSKRVNCGTVPLATTTFPAHSAPLGLEYFESTSPITSLKDSFLVALHGSGKISLGRGYRVIRVRPGTSPQDFITGFLQQGRVYGRPVDILKFGPAAFLLTDDDGGVIYYIWKPAAAPN